MRAAFAYVALALAATISPSRGDAQTVSSACPPEVTVAARCLRGEDGNGAFYVLAVPERWNNVLVVHAHGGPDLGPPQAARAESDLKRWAIVVNAGYAFAASTYRKGGFAMRSAIEDTERVRTLFATQVGVPRRTILHGQSWGAGVAAKAADLTRSSGRFPYDGILLTSGVLGSGARSYDFRLDLRAIYQYVCGNHPRPDEPEYHFGLGLPAQSSLTRAELAQRVEQCIGTPQQRTPEQAARLKTIVDVVHLPPSAIVRELEQGTWFLANLAQNVTGGRSAFGNVGSRYRGSSDDEALNRGVPRFAADPRAVQLLDDEAGYSGRFEVPVISIHAVNDPTALVELENVLRDKVARAGRSGLLLQAFVDFDTHSYWSDPVYPAALTALLNWIDRNERPSPGSLATNCAAAQAQFKGECRFLPSYALPSIDARIPKQ